MARLWDLGGMSVRELAARTWREFWKDRLLDQSAKCSYYFLLSVFPLLFFLVAVLGLLLRTGPELSKTLYVYVAAVVPPSATRLLYDTLAEITAATGAVKLSVALLATWWSASQGMRAVIEALNIAYEVPESRPWWKQILVASMLTFVSLALLTAALLMLIYGGRAAELLADWLGYPAIVASVWQAAQWLLMLLFVLVAFNFIYTFAPNTGKRRWRRLLPGTVVGVGLWLLVSFGFKIYLTYFDSYTVTYGSIGAVIVLMLWFYLSGIAILIGGEVNAEVDKWLLETGAEKAPV